MGSGKSTWIKNNHLEINTIEPDRLRLMYQGLVLNKDGRYAISQENDKEVWGTLFKMLENRMKHGSLSVIDATHTSTKSINRYKTLCDKYNYKCIVIDFSEVELQLALERNKNREDYKFIPEKVIIDAYNRLKNSTIPDWVKVSNPFEFCLVERVN
jgi:2',3'-cyclic-nucleotide 3'-phosphodiesterase